MTGMPNRFSNCRSDEGGSEAEADRTKRMRPGVRTPSGSLARMVMIAGTALIHRHEVESGAKPFSTDQGGGTRHQPATTPISRRAAPHSPRAIQDSPAFAILRVWIQVNGSGVRRAGGSPIKWSQSHRESRSA